jgi:hypothetical protein
MSYRRILGRMGYYDYQDGLIHHHIDQQAGWEDHQSHCRNFILKAVELYKPAKVTVLGSGWLLDLPLAELAECTGTVSLIDIIHPPDVIEQARKFNNVELIEQDITGGLIAEVWQKAGKYSFFKKLTSLDNIVIPEFQTVSDPGIIVSLNILTQLESLLVRYIRKRSKIREEEYAGFRARIQKKHLDFLEKHRSVIISDYEEDVTEKSGYTKVMPTLLVDLPDGTMREEWVWNFDKPGGDLYNSTSRFRIVALIC